MSKAKEAQEWLVVGLDESLERFLDAINFYRDHDPENSHDAPLSYIREKGRYISVLPKMLRLVQAFATAAGLRLESLDGRHGRMLKIVLAADRGFPILNRLRELNPNEESRQLFNDLGWCLDEARITAMEEMDRE